MRGSNGAGALPGTPVAVRVDAEHLAAERGRALRHGRHGGVAGADPDAAVGPEPRPAAGVATGAHRDAGDDVGAVGERGDRRVDPPAHEPHVERAAPVRHEAGVDAAVRREGGSTATPSIPPSPWATTSAGTASVRTAPLDGDPEPDRRRPRSVNSIPPPGVKARSHGRCRPDERPSRRRGWGPTAAAVGTRPARPRRR